MGDMDLVRPLGLAGVRCAVVARRGAPKRFSRFVRAAVDWADAWEQPEALVEALARFGSSQRDQPVLYYEGDHELLLVSRHRRRLADAFRFVIPDPALVEDLVDKARFRRLAERLDLPVPRSQSIGPLDSVADSQPELPFPFIVKPLTRRSDHWEPIGGSQKALQVDGARAWRELRSRLAAAQLPVLLQELIPGPETRIESYHVYVDDRGAIVGEFTGRKIRTYPAQYGHSTALETTDAADVRALGRALVERLGLRGVAKFDFKRRPDGTLCLLEVNPRFNLWHHPAAKAGVNIPELVYRDLVGLPRGPAPQVRPGARWVHPWFDYRAAKAQGLSLVRWAPWMLASDAKYAVALDDPLPIPRAAASRLGSRLRARSRAS
jgi:predicted ATP-grasp superfamily ATP-dependent carboligase